jgi:hypothetical protein
VTNSNENNIRDQTTKNKGTKKVSQLLFMKNGFDVRTHSSKDIALFVHPEDYYKEEKNQYGKSNIIVICF